MPSRAAEPLGESRHPPFGAARRTTDATRRPSRAAAFLLAWIALLVGLRLLHYGSLPIRAEAAAPERLAERLGAQGWAPLPPQRLIMDGSLTARRFGRGGCVLALVVLPPDPALLAVVRTG